MYLVKIIRENSISTHPVGSFWADGLSHTFDPRKASLYGHPLATERYSSLSRVKLNSNRFHSEVKLCGS
ncbi:hypothetical protein [Vibrio phage vB_VpaP_SJSY21]|nr:hypothetical protein [Vibrio phage vB_VpaP_SJSY21]